MDRLSSSSVWLENSTERVSRLVELRGAHLVLASSPHSILSIDLQLLSDVLRHGSPVIRSVSSIAFSISSRVRLFRYVGAFSFALAFFNAVPCYTLDGQYILLALSEKVSARYSRLSLLTGTCLLLVNISLAFVRYFALMWFLSFFFTRQSIRSFLKMKQKTDSNDGDVHFTGVCTQRRKWK